MYTPYDFNQSIANRAEYVEERLKSGMPVAAVSYDQGVLLLTLKKTQRKVFEVYDQLMYCALGNQADVEAVRLASIDFCHQEGFSRSPDDVSIQRLVGFTLSPPLKRAFGDPMTSPNVLRCIFAEMGRTPEGDQFFVLNYDGEFSTHGAFAVAGGTDGAEDSMTEVLKGFSSTPDLENAIARAKDAIRAGLSYRKGSDDEDEDTNDLGGDVDPLAKALENATFEGGILERNTPRESKFRLLTSADVN